MARVSDLQLPRNLFLLPAKRRLSILVRGWFRRSSPVHILLVSAESNRLRIPRRISEAAADRLGGHSVIKGFGVSFVRLQSYLENGKPAIVFSLTTSHSDRLFVGVRRYFRVRRPSARFARRNGIGHSGGRKCQERTGHRGRNGT